LVEVSATNPSADRQQADDYARGAIPVYWLVNEYEAGDRIFIAGRFSAIASFRSPRGVLASVACTGRRVEDFLAAAPIPAPAP
jgi:hypothetical protein